MNIISFMKNLDQNTVVMSFFGVFTVAISAIIYESIKSLNDLQKEQINALSNIVDELKQDIFSVEKELEKTLIELKKSDDVDMTNDADEEAEVEEEADEEDADSEYNYNLPTKLEKILNFISKADDNEIEMILSACSQNENIIIPNWYTQHDLMELTGESFSVNKWHKLYSKSEDLIDQSNALILQWYEQFNDENNYDSNEEYKYSDKEDLSDEDSSDEDSDEGLDEDSDESKTKMLLQDDDDSDEEEPSNEEEQSNEDDFVDEEESTNEEIGELTNEETVELTKELLSLKYDQLKELAGLKNNSLAKAKIVNHILQSKNINKVKENVKKIL